MVLFKHDKYNNTDHVIQLVQTEHHHKGLTIIPALVNQSYFCCLCGCGYEHKDAAHHNCEGPNCPACGHYGSKDRPGSQNYAKWEKKMLHVPIVTVRFMERNVMYITRKKEKMEKAYVKSGTIVYSVARNMKSIGRSNKSVTTVETVKTMQTQWNIGASFNL